MEENEFKTRRADRHEERPQFNSKTKSAAYYCYTVIIAILCVLIVAVLCGAGVFYWYIFEYKATNISGPTVTVEILEPSNIPNAATPKAGQTVIVHYRGTLTNGTEFDSSRNTGEPFKFRLGQGEVIRGWDIGIAQLKVGDKARLTCPPEFAYGEEGYPGIIPANATLIFEVEILGIEE